MKCCPPGRQNTLPTDTETELKVVTTTRRADLRELFANATKCECDVIDEFYKNMM